MNIVLISQCSKQALPATRRILDQFAERKGMRTWLTPITEAGLETLHGLLRRGARRNTAVACHRVRGGEMELLWIVGNRRKFDERGNVPTNTTGRPVLQRHRENAWRHSEAIALLASIAGLFHDFGKANALFQAKLAGTRKVLAEPLRHEWLSLRLFESFVGRDADKEWLARLGAVNSADEKSVLAQLVMDAEDVAKGNPLSALANRPVAWTVGWLICSHHRLPVPPRRGGGWALKGRQTERWQSRLRPSWISPQFVLDADETDAENMAKRRIDEMKKLWQFPFGLPFSSSTWRTRSEMISRRALSHPGFVDTDWSSMPLVLHTARCSLMLADHQYSAADATSRWQDQGYKASANTTLNTHADDTRSRAVKQRLDEHCIGVSHHAYLIARSLPVLRPVLPAIGNVRKLREMAKGRFTWQNQAFALAERVAADSRRQGGFFVNMASTGTGKTLANARMAFGLSKGGEGTRFTVLLGLRTLTLQTSRALRERLRLSEGDLATLVGSSAVRELHERMAEGAGTRERKSTELGSESASPLFAEHEYVRYDGALDDSRVGRWLHGDRDGTRLHRLISAPVVVGTIDHVMPATESGRGGHQIAPMLRLLTSDLVLDEPDDYDLADQPALCRLVHWAGLLGSRIVLSSATLPPALIENLFSAYRVGRQEFNRMTQDRDLPLICGWIDEFSAEHHTTNAVDEFMGLHTAFVDKRLERAAAKSPSRRLARLVDVPHSTGTVHEALAVVLREQIAILHEAHAQTSPDGHRVSVGVVRMANIDPLVATVAAIASEGGYSAADVHLCVYHSRHPLRRRAEIEAELDSLLNRTDPDAIWKHPSVVAACRRKAPNQIFVVVATSVAEVGRDHDYDWTIIEPSSMRSILQLCGRVLRHRLDRIPDEPNVALLGQNLRALSGKELSFTKPGYETHERRLRTHNIADVLPLEHRERPNLASRIREDENLSPEANLIDLEHVATRDRLDGDPSNFPASLWWKASVDWCFALQQKSPFRAGAPTETYALVFGNGKSFPRFMRFSEGEWSPASEEFRSAEPQVASGVICWPYTADDTLAAALTEELNDDASDTDLEAACYRYLTVSLDKRLATDLEPWRYHWWLGVFRPVASTS